MSSAWRRRSAPASSAWVPGDRGDSGPSLEIAIAPVPAAVCCGAATAAIGAFAAAASSAAACEQDRNQSQKNLLVEDIEV